MYSLYNSFWLRPRIKTQTPVGMTFMILVEDFLVNIIIKSKNLHMCESREKKFFIHKCINTIAIRSYPPTPRT